MGFASTKYQRSVNQKSSQDNTFRTLKRLCEQGRIESAVQQLDRHPSAVSSTLLYCVIRACTSARNLVVARQLQSLIERKKLQSSTYLGSHLIRLFAVCGSLREAKEVFCRLPRPNVFAWSEIILAHAKLGQSEEAIRLYYRLRNSGLPLDSHTYVAILQACANFRGLDHGKHVHKHIEESGHASSVFVASGLVAMYVQCGKLTDAYGVFAGTTVRNVVLWNAMIAGYAQHGHIDNASRLLRCMQQHGFQPNRETWNAVISGWVVNGHGSQALDSLQEMESMGLSPNHVTWNGLIAGFAQIGGAEEALSVFHQMQQEGTEPNSITYVSILKACCGIAALNSAKMVHAQMTEKGYHLDSITWNTVIKMYATFGSLKDACEVFEGLPERDAETWNSMISGYACHGMDEVALAYFKVMLQEGVQPDAITFMCLLSACSHLGRVREACYLFTSMRDRHGISPIQEHVDCMANLLGRMGSLIEAIDLHYCMPFQTSAEAWRSLLTHCETHADLELGKQCYESIISMDERDSTGYVLLSNIYVHTGANAGCV